MKKLVISLSYSFILIFLTTCRKDESGNENIVFDPSISSASVISINTAEIGGNGLSLISSRDDDSPISKNTFNSVVSKQGEQLLIVTDADNELRALTLSTPNSTSIEVMNIDTKSTAISLVFISPGILSTDVTEASLVINRIKNLSTFNAFASYLKGKLLTNSLNDLSGAVLYDSLLTDCVEEYYDKYILVNKGESKGELENKNMFSLTQATNNSIELKNYGYRFVNVIQRDVSSSSVQLKVKNSLPSMKGAVPLSWGSLLTLTTLNPTVEVLNYSTATNTSLTEFWIAGPGLKKVSDAPPDSVKVFGKPDAETVLYYVVFPFIDLWAGAKDLLKTSTPDFKELMLQIKTGRSLYFLTTATDAKSVARELANFSITMIKAYAATSSAPLAAIAAKVVTVSSVMFSGANLVTFAYDWLQLEPYSKFEITPTNGVPLMPKLDKPLNNAIDISVPIIFSWNNVSNSKSYSLQISKVADFSAIDTNIEGITTIGKQISDLLPSQKYYWRVKAINDNGSSSWSEIWNFTTKAKASVVSTSSVVTFTSNSAVVGGNITSDGGSSVTERGIFYGTSQNPETTGIKLQIGSGTGTFSTTLTGLTASTLYYVKAYATNSQGTSYGEQVTFTTLAASTGSDIVFNPNLTYGAISDIDGNSYKTIQIGTQTWMAENLKTTKYNDGSVIPNITDNSQWLSMSTPAYSWYNNDITNKSTYGALYNWYTVNTGKLCPSGWHVPSNDEWKQLEMYLGMSQTTTNILEWRGINEGGKLKETGLGHWQSPNTGATNEAGFTGLPGGIRWSISGTFGNSTTYSGAWWSSTQYNTSEAFYRALYWDRSTICSAPDPKIYGFSVRCIKDATSGGNIPTNGLVAYYPFNGNANDESGNGKNGTVYGATLTTDRFGQTGKAYSFLGNNENRITLSPFVPPAITTISIWFNPATSGPTGYQNSVLFSNAEKFVNHDEFRLVMVNGQIVFQITNSAGTGYSITSNTTITLNQWHHLVCTVNDQKQLRMYIDNILQTQTVTWVGTYNGQSVTNIGNYVKDDDNFDGLLDDIRIYNHELTPQEIATLFNQTGR